MNADTYLYWFVARKLRITEKCCFSQIVGRSLTRGGIRTPVLLGSRWAAPASQIVVARRNLAGGGDHGHGGVELDPEEAADIKAQENHDEYMRLPSTKRFAFSVCSSDATNAGAFTSMVVWLWLFLLSLASNGGFNALASSRWTPKRRNQHQWLLKR